MAELDFMSVDPDNEISEQAKEINLHSSNDSIYNDEPVPRIEKIEDHINSLTKTMEPGTEVLEICGETVNPHKKVNAEDFQVMKVIGKGGYGTVFLVQKATKSADNGKFYAMKVLKKAKLVRNEKNTVHTVSERNILQTLKHPFLVRLHYAFQNRSNLYIVLEYCPGGELFRYLERECFLTEDAACFYISEIALAIGHLHSLGIIYRDLKPENILLDKDGHVKLTDFGLSKEGVNTTNTFCGTIEYMAPEIIRCAGHGQAVDWWSLGTLLFDMLSGGPPFSQEGNKKATAEKILRKEVKFPNSFSDDAKSLIRGLLKKDPKDRLGSEGGVEDIKKHVFFIRHDVDWDDVFNRRTTPPFRPELSSDSDVSMFDPSFTGMRPIISPGNADDPVPQDLFQGFSFVASSVVDHPRAIVPDFSRFRNQNRNRLSRTTDASADPHCQKSPRFTLSPNPPGLEAVENNQPFKNADQLQHNEHGVDLRDFASPPTSTVPPTTNTNTVLHRVSEGADEDNIPGAQEIGRNGGRGSPPHAHTASSGRAKVPPNTLQQKKPKNGSRKLGDAKPGSFPNLHITTEDQLHSKVSTTSGFSNGHPSSGNLRAMQQQVSGNGRPSKSMASPPRHHHQALSGDAVYGHPNGKDAKCSVM